MRFAWRNWENLHIAQTAIYVAPKVAPNVSLVTAGDERVLGPM